MEKNPRKYCLGTGFCKSIAETSQNRLRSRRAPSVTYLSPPTALLLPRRARRTIAISRETNRLFSLFSRPASRHLFFGLTLISNGQTTIQLSGRERFAASSETSSKPGYLVPPAFVPCA